MAGEIVTVGGDVTVGSSAVLIRADDTKQIWTVRDVAGTGWYGLAPPITRGAVRGTQGNPFEIIRVDAASKFSAGEIGTTKIEGAPAPAPVRVYTRPDGSTRPLRQFDLYYPGHPGDVNASPPLPAGGDPTRIDFLNRDLIPQFLADLEQRLRDKEIPISFAEMLVARAALPWKVPPELEGTIFLPPGVTDVSAVQPVVTVTGSVHPDTLRAIESGLTAEILAYTAEKTGRTYDGVLGEFSERLRAMVQDGVGQEDFPSIEGALARLGDPVAISRGGLAVSTEEILQGEGFGAVDLRNVTEKVSATFASMDRTSLVALAVAAVVVLVLIFGRKGGR